MFVCCFSALNFNVFSKCTLQVEFFSVRARGELVQQMTSFRSSALREQITSLHSVRVRVVHVHSHFWNLFLWGVPVDLQEVLVMRVVITEQYHDEDYRRRLIRCNDFCDRSRFLIGKTLQGLSFQGRNDSSPTTTAQRTHKWITSLARLICFVSSGSKTWALFLEAAHYGRIL